ncbi:ABC transporter permease [Paludibaculum fermentans]|uniref:ABC transporter permease n=1 Tax=Paludibaculum fermentans TaxID=1473598 RepID=A0A7S7NP67_PALFE|nr:ABC transporter permease [Paludibaculum fermentans]QOY87227.1 ABC transporter permease [Paludibaculum fermentans]
MSLLADIRYAVRTLRQNPGFSLVAIGVLALGIGGNTAIFSVVNSVLLRPLPFPDPSRLTIVWETSSQQGVKREGPSGPNFYDWREQSRLYQDLAAVELGTGTLTGLGEPRQVPAMRVTTNLFSVLGARPALGRFFTPQDGHGGRKPLLLISDGFWRNTLGADPAVIGKSVMMDLISYQVIGVLRPGFGLPFQSDLFVPWPDDELRYHRSRLGHDLGVFGRLKPGVTPAQAQAELNTIQTRLAALHPEIEGWQVAVLPLQSVTVEYIRATLLVLFASVAFVLLIACTNVANLLLARAVGRRREIAMRAALGASRGRLVRQFLTESVVLSSAAGVVGTLLAYWAVALLSAIVPATVPIPDAAAEVTLRGFDIDGRVLAFSLAVSLLTGILFGLAPALHALKTDLIENLKQTTRTGAESSRSLRDALLAAEIALALVLSLGAGLMLKSFSRLQNADLGIRPDHLLTLEMELPTDMRYQQGAEQSAFYSQVLERAQALPGVRNAALTSILPLHAQGDRVRFLIENGPVLPANERFQADFRRVSPAYFQTMGIPLKSGRLFDGRDSAGAPLAVIADEAFLRRYFRGNQAIGRRLLLGRAKAEIVGVVADVKHTGPDQEARPTLYSPYLQAPTERMNLVLSTAGEPAALIESAKHAIWSIDPDMPVYRLETMRHIVDEATSSARLTLSLLSVFAAAALGLAAFGIFGVVAYTINLRLREFGIRMALGARPADVQRLVVRQTLRVVGAGIFIGVLGSFALTRLMSVVLYQVSANDPATTLSAAALLFVVAITAAWLPAFRVARIDPMQVLREQ